MRKGKSKKTSKRKERALSFFKDLVRSHKKGTLPVHGNENDGLDFEISDLKELGRYAYYPT